MQINRTAAYTTSDGKQFNDRKAAVEHEKDVVRKQRLHALLSTDDTLIDALDSLDGLIGYLTRNSDELVKALTVTQPRKKAEAA